MRFIWFVTLCAFVSGCASWQSATLPGLDSEPIPDEKEVVVQQSSKVRVTTRVGEVIEGEVTDIASDQLTILKPGNYGRDERVVRFQDIHSVEIEQGSTTTTVLLVSAVVVGVGLILGFREAIKAGVGED